jgi:hypothetical protein
MTFPTSDKWLEDQSEHALACALSGDCIYDVVEKHAQNMESSWKSLASGWQGLVRKASRKAWGLFERVSEEWLLHTLLSRPVRKWPRGLGREQVVILRILREAAQYNAGSSGRGRAPSESPSPELALEAFQVLSSLTFKSLAVPMWGEYNQTSQKAAREIAPLCAETYGEPCTLGEAELMFQGDLERGWRMKTLDVSSPTYRVFPEFLAWVAAS